MPERPSPRYIVICERKSDAPGAIKTIKDGKIKFISASPEVCYELTKVGVKYSDIESFFPENLGDTDEVYDKIYSMCTEIDMENNFNAARDNFYFIKMLYDGLHIRAMALKQIIEKEKPDKIVVFTDEESQSDIRYPFGESDNIYAMLLKTGKFKTEYVILKRPKAPRRRTEGEKKIREIPQPIYNILYCMKYRGIWTGIKTLIYTIKNKIVGGKTLITLSKYNYSWQHIIPELTKNGFDIVTIDLSEFMAPFKGEPTKNLEAAKKYCIVNGIDFSDPFLKILKKKIAVYDSTKIAIYQATKRIIKAYKPYAFVGSIKSTSTEHIIARTASDYWIPVITWQHGAAYPPNYSRMIPFNEMMNSDVHFTFGEGYARFDRKFGCRIIPVGSYDLERLFFSTGKRKKEFDILYVTASYAGNLLYSSTSTDNKLWKAQKEILDMLAKQKHLKVAVKLHPNSKDDHVIYKYLGEENIEIFKDERTYRDIMRHSKVVIVDYPSTTMLEAMAAGKEMFVLSDQVKLTEEQKELLRKRVYLYETPGELKEAIQKYVNGEIIDNPPERTNNEFLIRYGTHTLDKRVAERVIKSLKEINRSTDDMVHQ